MMSRATWSDYLSLDDSNALSAANRLLPPWVSLILVVAIAWQIAKIIWMLVPGPAVGDNVPVPASATSGTTSTESSADVQAIANAHMFGVADAATAEPTPAPTEDENLSDTRLTNLTLKGTVAATPSDRAVAIIADGRNEEEVYAIGDSVGSRP